MNHQKLYRKRVFMFNVAAVFIVLTALILGSALGVGEAAERDSSSQLSSADRASKGGDKGGGLGCQKNNPNRVDCSSLEVSGVCRASDGVAVFTIRNTGERGDGDMLRATEWRIVDENGVVVASGSVLLRGGESMTVEWSGGGRVTLYADQQIGHPGSSQPQATVYCPGGPTETPTEEPTEEPTVEPTPTEDPTETPTEEPTQTPEFPELDVVGICLLEWPGTHFIVTNLGETMTSPATYTVIGLDGRVLAYGVLSLEAGEYVQIDAYINGSAILIIEFNGEVREYEVFCEDLPTETPTEEVPDDPELDVDAQCKNGTDFAGTYFLITNLGGAMPEPATYVVLNDNGDVLQEGTFQLEAYGAPNFADTFEIFLADVYEPVTLVVNYQGVIRTQSIFCPRPTPTEEPTEEPTVEPTPTETPTEEPTIEPTPTETPTEEPTEEPTAEPTPSATPSATPSTTPSTTPTYGCQGNNPDRLDCSSLEVSAVCTADGIAVFTIVNTGEPGNGDMVQATEWRIVDASGNVVASGSVLLAGGTSMTVEWSGGGRVTLYADQQVGHPGNSQPQATVNC